MQGPNYVPPSQRKPRSLSPLKDHRKNVQKLKRLVGLSTPLFPTNNLESALGKDVQYVRAWRETQARSQSR